MTGHLLAGRYELRGVLGRGGMAEVRDGWDTRFNRPVAVKLLYPVFSERSDLRRRFADEARSAGSLSHPNIVTVYDSGEDRGAPFIVMERLSGDTLGDLMAAGPMDPPRVRAVLDQVLAALQAAHAAGVLHRDIKPANILLCPSGVKVADFGIAKSSGSAPTTTGQLVGTMCYLSPQRVLGAPASAADDLYAAGLVGYEALLGAPAYQQDNLAALARAITDEPLPPLTGLRGDVDPLLAEVVDRALTRDAHHRFASAGQMRAALAGDRAALAAVTPARRPATKVMDQPPVSSVYPAPVVSQEKHSRARRFAFVAGIVAAFAVAAWALAMMGPFSSTPEPEPISTSTSTTPPPPPTTTSPTPTVTPVTQAPEPPKEKKPKGEGRPGRGNGNGNGRSG
ncbi:serine/threonine-protein kinase [Mycolicibacterium arenosum]|uniref:non-specific serine/threonine protein kinase n=1 Tax=Mycolicibacterium arenosum TaxID=2952157 RepID=A0ABT1M356_9MYCO|nr:serine/threonine-protein kinase [Mycolicibacterium sp. CAU 1645]MCP9272277.1 serine/threonine protein kinase [Mycolicibacterium sp. CAU 1645]